jgi:hypothetical protein
MKFVIASTILLLVFGTVNGQTGQKIQTDRSPSGKIIAEHYLTSPPDKEPEDNPRQIFLKEPAGHSRSIFLATYNRNAEVLFSPDEKWLVLDDHAGSNISAIRVFKHTQGLHYLEESTDSPLNKKVWELFRKRHFPNAKLDFLHTYTVALCWGRDSDSVVVEIHGDAILLKDNSVVGFGPWRCVYSMSKSAATDDPETLRQIQSGGICN